MRGAEVAAPHVWPKCYSKVARKVSTTWLADCKAKHTTMTVAQNIGIRLVSCSDAHLPLCHATRRSTLLHLDATEYSESAAHQIKVNFSCLQPVTICIDCHPVLQVSPDQLMMALTTRAIETFGERIVKQLDAAAASVSRDALAKNLYAKLFDWLVAAINRKISAIGIACLSL